MDFIHVGALHVFALKDLVLAFDRISWQHSDHTGIYRFDALWQPVIYGAFVLVQWCVVGFGISFFFRSRQWFFNSTILFWLLFPLTFVPLILTSSGIKYWCGFGVGQPREWLYYCENVGATFFSVPALLEDLSLGLVGVILVRQLAKYVFGKSHETKPQS